MHMSIIASRKDHRIFVYFVSQKLPHPLLRPTDFSSARGHMPFVPLPAATDLGKFEVTELTINAVLTYVYCNDTLNRHKHDWQSLS